ncbi:ABC transporter permease [Pseudoflavonifractor capillosus]|uniref:ABC transporter permease n=1 Tax=Pseudoflavonifractor capillosus TaxID=106588 RepID=A0A921MKP6_9FIRM|nr:ABC transporter permease [Pseudoflavonifractor capillosus]HJG86037.1 ABC transporter permease [Pseudoflavonifractor capillosus]
MNFTQSFRLALKSLATSKMRALLTMLGIIIGVAAVIIIISLGDGMNDMINSEFEKMGTNLLQVQIMGRGSSQNITEEEMYALKDENPDCIAAMSPSVSSMATVKQDSETLSATLTGVGEEYIAVKSLELSQGRFIQYIDTARMQNVCVIGSYVNEETFNGAGLGQTLRINGNEYTVVGVLAEQADNTSYGNDNTVYIPYTNATRLNGNAVISQYMFTATSEDTNARAKAVIESKLEQFYGGDDYYIVISMSEMMDMMGNIQGTVMTVLVAIAAISLLVGGIGIMNIMLVSVTERTREIGIRKSLGAKGRDIRRQFIIEAGTTSVLGGVIGIVLGVSLATVAGNLVGITAKASLSAIAISAGVSLAVGVLFGYLPANKAAKLNPIDALRYE